MKIVKIKSNSIILLFFLLITGFCFTSCENFLKAGSVKVEIEKAIEYANAPSYEIRVQCDEGTGTILTQTILKKKVTDVFSIEFQMAEGFQFDTWKVYTKNSDGPLIEQTNRYIEIKDYNKDSRDGIYKVTVKFAKAADNLVIKPVCFDVPRITEVYPPDSLTGCDQDTMLRISFNKPMNTESFLDNNDDFTCISISDHLVFYDYAHNKTDYYYGVPYFSEDAKTLYIPVIKGKHILPLEGDLTKKDLELSLDFSNVTDQDGIDLNVEQSHIYRINQGVDNTKPVFSNAKIYSTSDKSDPYYKELSSLDFASWSQEPNGSYQYGTFSQNHVGNTVYFELSGYDVKPGISGVKIVETYYRSVTGDDGLNIKSTKVLPVSIIGENLYSLDYSFTCGDGIVKLELALIDYAQNECEEVEKKVFYVLKDSLIDINVISFDEVSKMGKMEVTDAGTFMIWESNPDGTESCVLTLKENCNDTMYDTLKSEYDVEIYYDTVESGTSYKAEKYAENNRIKYRITKRPEDYLYVTVQAFDQAGNCDKYKRCILPDPEFNESCCTIDTKDEKKQLTAITPFNSNVFLLAGKYYSLYYLTLGSQVCLTPGIAPRAPLKLQIDYNIENSLNLRSTNSLVYGKMNDTSGYEIWLSGNSSDYVTVKIGAGQSWTNQTLTFNCSSYMGLNDSGYDNYINSCVKITTTPIKNKSKYKVKISDYKKAGVSEDIIYKFKFICAKKSSAIISEQDTLYLPSEDTYSLNIIAITPQGNSYISPNLSLIENESIVSTKKLPLTKDLTPPIMETYASENTDLYNMNLPNMYEQREYYKQIPKDTGVGIYVNKDGLCEIEYCFIPSYNNDIRQFNYFTEEELRQNYSDQIKILTYKPNAEYYYIPMGHLQDGLYTLCQIAKDKNGNSVVKCSRAFNKLLGEKAKISFDHVDVDSGYFYLKFQYTNLQVEQMAKLRNHPEVKRYNKKSEEWQTFVVYIEEKDEKTNSMVTKISLSNTSIDSIQWCKVTQVYDDQTAAHSGHLDNIFFYYPYESNKSAFTCNRKNYLELANGYEVFADAPVLAHTLWCYVKLTDTNTKDDVQIWLNKGMETGVIQSDESLTYTYDNYNDIPEGAWYTTVFHFVDGTVLMTEVKQK